MPISLGEFLALTQLCSSSSHSCVALSFISFRTCCSRHIYQPIRCFATNLVESL